MILTGKCCRNCHHCLHIPRCAGTWQSRFLTFYMDTSIPKSWCRFCVGYRRCQYDSTQPQRLYHYSMLIWPTLRLPRHQCRICHYIKPGTQPSSTFSVVWYYEEWHLQARWLLWNDFFEDLVQAVSKDLTWSFLMSFLNLKCIFLGNMCKKSNEAPKHVLLLLLWSTARSICIYFSLSTIHVSVSFHVNY